MLCFLSKIFLRSKKQLGMDAKLQNLLEKIYEDGVSKGHEAGNAALKSAQIKAEALVSEATLEATRIREEARKEVEQLIQNTRTEIQLASEQAIQNLKQRIQNLLTVKIIAAPVKAAFNDKAFIQDMILKMIDRWTDKDDGLRLLLPKEEADLFEFFTKQTEAALAQGLQVELDQKSTNGFRIGPADGRYQLSFSDADFEAFFTDFLRPATRTWLFHSL